MQDPKKLIIERLKGWQEENSLDLPFEVSLVTDSQFGDFSTNIAMVLAKDILDPRIRQDDNLERSRQGHGFEMIKNPRELAESIVSKLQEKGEINQVFKRIEVAGPGFINFYLSQEYLFQSLESIVQPGPGFDTTNNKNGQTIIVEYSSPNIAKPFTIGHLRSTIIGCAIANLLEAVGYEVKRDNHLGDWGAQFGKQIYAIKTWGNIDEIENSENPVKPLVELYVKFHEEAEKNPDLEEEARVWFKKLEDGDREARELWKKCVDWSMKEFDRIYQLLGVKFTENNGQGYGESFFEDKMSSVIDELQEKGLVKVSEGAELVFFADEKYPPLMILKKDGTTLYATRDLATDKFRLESYPNVTIINEVGIEQELYFRQLFEVEKLLGWVKEGQRIHIKHGHFRFSDGKMSTRKGNVIWLEDVIEEAKKRAYALSGQETKFEGSEAITRSLKESEAARKYNPGVATRINNSEKIAIGAIKWNDLKRESKQDITFDWDDILNMQGNSGPYLMYTYVRTSSVMEKAQRTADSGQIIDDYNLEKEESELLRFLVQFPYVLEQAADIFAPNLLCNYLFELSQKFNLFYQKHSILSPALPAGSDPLKGPTLLEQTREYRIELTQAVGIVLKKGLTILGIETVERM